MKYVIGKVIGVESVWKVVRSVDSPIMLFCRVFPATFIAIFTGVKVRLGML